MQPITQQAAAGLTQNQAIGFGEEHTSAAARTVLVQWLQNGTVTDVILELAPPWDAEGVQGEQYKTAVALADLQRPNQIGLTQVITDATANNVRIHCWDPVTRAKSA